MEIKKADSKELFEQGLVQTSCYIRLVLREQLDRRFCIALLLCRDALTVFLNDRSGLFFTEDSINIHTDPRKFIQVIAALSILKPCQIGWDPHMKVYDPESGEAKVSYLVGDEARFFKPSLAKTHWEIDVPSSVEGKREKVITLAAISISRAEVMCGRATLVWEVIRKATPFNTNEVRLLTSVIVFILVLIYARFSCSSVIGARIKKLKMVKMYRQASCLRAKDIVKFLHGKIVSSPTRIY